MTVEIRRPVALVILDGWGINPVCEHNAVCQADTPRLRALLESWPHAPSVPPVGVWVCPFVRWGMALVL